MPPTYGESESVKKESTSAFKGLGEAYPARLGCGYRATFGASEGRCGGRASRRRTFPWSGRVLRWRQRRGGCPMTRWGRVLGLALLGAVAATGASAQSSGPIKRTPLQTFDVP